jgi:hypothetical protein
MGLYLAVFDNNEEVEGVEVGSYADFGVFRDTVASRLEGGVAGSLFPVLMVHSDSDGSWSPDEAIQLQIELEKISEKFRLLPPLDLIEDSWQYEVAKSVGLRPKNLYESFFDIDGEPLIERLLDLIRVSKLRVKEILFQ